MDWLLDKRCQRYDKFSKTTPLIKFHSTTVYVQENNHLRKLVELADDSTGNGRGLLGSSHLNLPLDGRGNGSKFALVVVIVCECAVRRGVLFLFNIVSLKLFDSTDFHFFQIVLK
jgi:hypothetical protein